MTFAPDNNKTRLVSVVNKNLNKNINIKVWGMKMRFIKEAEKSLRKWNRFEYNQVK